MQKALQVLFRGMDQSEAIIESVEQKASKMERLNKRIISCKVVVSSPHNHHNKGKQYEVNIDVGVPNNNIVVHQVGEDAYVTVRDAFSAAERQLKAMSEKSKVKAKSKDMSEGESTASVDEIEMIDELYYEKVINQERGQAAA